MIYSSMKHYNIYNFSLLISQNNIKYMLNPNFKLHSQ